MSGRLIWSQEVPGTDPVRETTTIFRRIKHSRPESPINRKRDQSQPGCAIIGLPIGIAARSIGGV